MELKFIDNKVCILNVVFKYIISLVILLLLDGIYFKLANKVHDGVFKNIKPKNIRIPSALISWSLLAITVTILNPMNQRQSIIYGAVAGFIIYGVYNSTNYATIKDWTLDMCFYDTLWGTFLCAMVSLAVYHIFGSNYYNNSKLRN